MCRCNGCSSKWLCYFSTVLNVCRYQRPKVRRGPMGQCIPNPNIYTSGRSRFPKHLVTLGMLTIGTDLCSICHHHILSHIELWLSCMAGMITQWCKTASLWEAHIQQLFWLWDNTYKSSLSSLAKIVTVLNRKEINKETQFKTYAIPHCSIDMKCMLFTLFPND